MANAQPLPASVVILLDPSDTHITLDGEEYHIFRRFTTFPAVLNLINGGQFGQIDLHVPTNFHFDRMRPHPRVYMHTYFVDNQETSFINVIEREKIRDSIRTCCKIVGEEFIERGIMEANDFTYDEGINLAEQLAQMDIDRATRLLQ